MSRRFVSFTLALAFTAPAYAASDADYRAILERHYPADAPGAAVIVTRGEETLYRDARGMADLELGVPLAPDMVFRLGSITKQFTGVAIRLLELEGKLSLSDPLTKFLPDYPLADAADVTPGLPAPPLLSARAQPPS